MTQKKRVILIRSNLIDPDIRWPKEIAALKREDYVVTLLFWNRECKATRADQWGEVDCCREIQLMLKAPMGIAVLLFIPIWWCFVFLRLMLTGWDTAHAIDFDSLLPAIVAGKLKRKPVIYEILDTWEDMIVLPRIVRHIFVQVDKLFMRWATAIILADEVQTQEFGGIPNSRVITVYDSPPDISGKMNITPQKNDVFTLFYAGTLYKARQLGLDKALLAISSTENVKLIIAGHGDLVNEIKELSNRMPDRVQFIGRIGYDEALERSASADLLFVVRNAAIPVYKYICGCKILEAMMCGKPIIANKGTSTADKVSGENCGLVVDANNPDEIREAIIKLRDNPELCRELGVNGRKAYEQRYSWEIMERRLIALYNDISRNR